MVTAGTTTLMDAQRIHRIFPLIMAVFSLYILGLGYRSLLLKPLVGTARVVSFDWPAVGVGLAVFLSTDGVCFPGG